MGRAALLGSAPDATPPAFVRTGLRTSLTFLASFKEGLEPRAPLLRDMCLLSAGIFLQVFLFRSAAHLALLAAQRQRRGSQRARNSSNRPS